jgi:bifunctional DNA-binding transcriptional regulator/antitoxin component of YhaV-PrlF toxin-antitoxin module
VVSDILRKVGDIREYIIQTREGALSLLMPMQARMQRRGYTRLSRKLQANFPKEAVEAAGLRPGDELRAEAVGPGEICFVGVRDPLEALDELAHEFAGMYPPGYLDD